MELKVIRTRNWDIVNFDPKRIELAIEKACEAIWVQDIAFIPNITKKIVEDLEDSIWDNSEYIVWIEDIQDIVEKNLMEEGYYYVAKEYIIYRQKRIEERKRKSEIRKKTNGTQIKSCENRWKKRSFWYEQS